MSAHLILPYSEPVATKLRELLLEGTVHLTIKACEDGYIHGYPSDATYLRLSGKVTDIYLAVDVLLTGGLVK